jgi:hypothetical protein
LDFSGNGLIGMALVGLSTNKVVLRTVEEFMGGYTPVYKPIYPLFLGKAQQYAAEVGKHEFRRVTTVGDIRAKHITPKDTEMRQVAVMEGKKAFKKYFLANQFQLSNFQDRQGIEDVVTQVLDEHQLHQDELFLLGEGTSNSNMINNGLYHSGDANYTLEDSEEIDDDSLYAFHAAVMANATKAKAVAGQKLVIMYGETVLTKYNSLFDTAVKPVKVALAETLGEGFSFAELPAACTPAGANGWIMANMEQTKLHYTVLPGLLNQGINDEMLYFWSNFLMGSMMLEVLAKDAVIRQPVTFA